MTQLELQKYWKTLNILFGAIFMGILLFFVVANFVLLDVFTRIEDQTTSFILGIVSIGIVLVDYMLIGILSDKLKLNTGSSGNPVLDKLNEYRTSLIVKLVMMESGIFVGIIIYLLVQNYMPLVALVVGFALLIRLKPNKEIVEEIAGMSIDRRE